MIGERSSVLGGSLYFEQHSFFPSVSVPGHEIKFETSILDYPCGLWDTLIIENDST